MNKYQPLWLWKFPNLPEVPQTIVDLAIKSINHNHDPKNKDYIKSDSETFIQDGKIKKNNTFLQFLLDENVVNWIHQNIVKEGYHGNIRIAQSTTDPMGEEKHKVAHTDATRDFTLIYLLESGGINHRTVFYKEHDKPLVRERKTVVRDYSLLEELASVRIPLKRWIILQSQILHAVENIPNHRVSFQIGIDDLDGIKTSKDNWTDV